MTARKAGKERTRSKLIQATIRVLHRQGSSALTTGRIAETAGVAQPTFYVHFHNMDDALEQAADAITEKLLERLRGYREDMTLENADQVLRGVFESSVDAMLAEPRMTEVFLRHRWDVDSPLGKRFRGVIDRAREDLTRDLRRLGIDESVIDHPEVHAEIVIGMVLTVVEALIEKRLDDREACIEALDHIARASMAAALEQQPAKKKGR